jgi:hypothetical protein
VDEYEYGFGFRYWIGMGGKDGWRGREHDLHMQLSENIMISIIISWG